MIELLRRYTRLMKTHDFSYQYSDDRDYYWRENLERLHVMKMKSILSLTPRGRRVVAMAEKRYGYVQQENN